MSNIRVLHCGSKTYIANGCTVAQAEEAFDKMNSTVNMVVGAANTIAGKVLNDFVEWLKKDENMHHYRQRVKLCVNNALKEFERYESIHYRNFGEKYGLFLDYLDETENEVMPDVDKVYWSFKSCIDKAGEPQSEFFAKIEQAMVVAEIACAIYDRLTEEIQKQTGFDFRPQMKQARLTGTLHWLDVLEKAMCKKTTKDVGNIDLNKDKNCNLATSIVMRKLTDYDLFNKIGAKAIAFHPELRAELNEEDKKILDEAMEKCS